MLLFHDIRGIFGAIHVSSCHSPQNGWRSVAAFLFTITACEDPNAPGAKKPADPKPVDPPAPVAWAGTVKATAQTTGGTRLQSTLAIADDGDFRLATLTTPATATASVRRLQTAATTTTNTAPVLIAMSGTSAAVGGKATLAVAGVKKDGVALEGADLNKYQACELSGTPGAGFHAEVLAAAATCVLAAGDVPVAAGDDTTVTPGGVTVDPVPSDAKPIDVLIGKWGGVLVLHQHYGDVVVYSSPYLAVVWEFAETGVSMRYYNSQISGEFVLDNEVFSAEALADFDVVKYTSCQKMNAHDPELLEVVCFEQPDGEWELPVYYLVSGDLLYGFGIPTPVFYGDDPATVKREGTVVYHMVPVELRRGYEPETPQLPVPVPVPVPDPTPPTEG